MFGTAFRQIILWTLVCGLVYPLVITLLAGLLPAPPVRQLVGEDFDINFFHGLLVLIVNKVRGYAELSVLLVLFLLL